MATQFLKIQPDILVNLNNVAYIELTGKGAADVHFVGKVKPLHLKPTEAAELREYVSGRHITDITKAA